MNLKEIINNKSCLSYFVQFLETKKALSLIKFYLDVESFKVGTGVSSTNSRIKHTCKCLTCKKINVCDKTYMRSKSKTKQYLKSSESLQDILICSTDFHKNNSLKNDEKSELVSVSSNSKDYDLQSKFTKKTSSAIASDAIKIYRKYFTMNSPELLEIPATILSNVSLALCSVENQDIKTFSVAETCFGDVQKYIFELLEKDYLNDFLDSEFYCKYCVDILTSPNLSLSDILHCESVLFYFMEYLEQENQRDYLLFWLAATNFRKHYEENLRCVLHEEATKDAMIIYEKYFSLQSQYPLKLSSSIRSTVEEHICGDMEVLITCFDIPIMLIEQHLEENYFDSFLSSQLFKNYLSELKLKIKNHKIYENLNCHQRIISDISSENVQRQRNSLISQHNTLLAMESTKITKSTKLTGLDMKVNYEQITNPNLLWYRSSAGMLSLGRVDPFGRYERDFDFNYPNEKWSISSHGNKIKSAMRKLINLPEDKVQEEVAWQVAEMIVRDITTITLGKNL